MNPDLPVGTAAPAFHLKNLLGATVSLDDLTAAGKPILLLFTSLSCLPCAALAQEITVWQDDYGDVLTIVKISEGAPTADRHPERLLLQFKREVADAFQCWGTPGAVLVQPDGMVGSQVAKGVVAIRALVASAVQLTADPKRKVSVARRAKRGLDIGEKPPTLAFVDQHGQSLALDDFRGREVILVFWNPDCGFCQRMLTALKLHDASPPKGGPSLIVISSAAAERNRTLGLVSPVVHDSESRAMVAFGVRGTPAAVLLDARGLVASGRAAGGDAVMDLASSA
jgi:peroxiredoxin